MAVIALVLGLHLLLGWALLNGLAQRVVEVVRNPVQVALLLDTRPVPPPPPPPPPPPATPRPPPSPQEQPAQPARTAPPPPSFAPPPEVAVNPPLAQAPTITTAVAAPEAPVRTAPPTVAAPPGPPAPSASPAPPAPAPAAPPRVLARPAIGNVAACAPRGEDYPPAAVRAEATGTTRLRFNVDASGKLASAEVVKSAGASREHRQLDRVALGKLSECTFKPGNDENGKPVGGTFEVEYVWKLD